MEFKIDKWKIRKLDTYSKWTNNLTFLQLCAMQLIFSGLKDTDGGLETKKFYL